MKSEIQSFYQNKTVFVTGGTGFIGKVIIEKLLRTTDATRIYLLIRSKRGKSIEERLDAWRKDALFDVLLATKPQALDRVHPIVGDCLEPNLGLSESDRALLISQVEVVLHGAATVRFNEPLHVALTINTRATRFLVQLAQQMSHLEAFVHISTAFSNCVVSEIHERFYSELLSCSAEKVMGLSDLLGNELFDKMAPALMGKYFNTYTYTKALAEDVILREASNLPVCIFRPAIIVATHKEPVSGWINNLYGPIGLLYGSAHGVIRVFQACKKKPSYIVPVDYCASMALSAAWNTAQENGPRQIPTIYNFTPSEQNQIYNGAFLHKVHKYGYSYPINKAIWYPFMICVLTPWLFQLTAFFYHTLPGYLIDSLLYLRGQKTHMVKTYRKIHEGYELIVPFSTNLWRFDNRNTKQLWKSMSTMDRQLFTFDMDHLDWNEYFKNALVGMRLYLGKEPPTPESLNPARKRHKRLYILHLSLQFVLFCVAALVLRSFVVMIF